MIQYKQSVATRAFENSEEVNSLLARINMLEKALDNNDDDDRSGLYKEMFGLISELNKYDGDSKKSVTIADCAFYLTNIDTPVEKQLPIGDAPVEIYNGLPEYTGKNVIGTIESGEYVQLGEYELTNESAFPSTGGNLIQTAKLKHKYHAVTAYDSKQQKVIRGFARI